MGDAYPTFPFVDRRFLVGQVGDGEAGGQLGIYAVRSEGGADPEGGIRRQVGRRVDRQSNRLRRTVTGVGQGILQLLAEQVGRRLWIHRGKLAQMPYSV